MDGRVFLDSARYLMAAPSEANRRSAAGPLYCAVLNEARAALERWGFPVPAQVDIDDFVLSRFNTIPNMDLLRVADPLIQLEQNRQLADDSLSGSVLFADDSEVQRLLRLVEIGIDLLDQIEADSARRTTAIADIQKAFP
jgi:hypothetical protein